MVKKKMPRQWAVKLAIALADPVRWVGKGLTGAGTTALIAWFTGTTGVPITHSLELLGLGIGLWTLSNLSGTITESYPKRKRR